MNEDDLERMFKGATSRFGILAMETETANAIAYVCVAVVLTAFIVCGAWVLVRLGWPRNGVRGVLKDLSGPPTWSSKSETRTEHYPPQKPDEDATGEKP